MADDQDAILPLFAAAVIAYERVLSTRRNQHVTPSVDELDLVALVLSSRLPIYGVRAEGDEATRISQEELMEGMFWGGAMRLELGAARGAITRLAVRKSEFEDLMGQLKSRPMDL
jgi:hypothetical protein